MPLSGHADERSREIALYVAIGSFVGAAVLLLLALLGLRHASRAGEREAASTATVR